MSVRNGDIYWDEPSWKTSRRAVCMVMKGDLSGAQRVLAKKEEDIYIANCKCFISTITNLILEAPDYTNRQNVLSSCRQLEERCATDNTKSWMSAVKNRVFRGIDNMSFSDYDKQIIHVDALVYIGCLTAATIETISVGTAAKAVYGMSRAWKMYQQSYSEILKIYCTMFEVDDDVPKWPPVLKCKLSASKINNQVNKRMIRSSTTSFEFFRKPDMTVKMTPEEAIRLMTAVSTGYGGINLFLSLLPAKIASMTLNMLGFRGNRQTGLDALSFAKNGPDMHAPIAWLIISWYHMNVTNSGIEFDEPLFRENRELCLNEIKNLAHNPPLELRGSWLQKFFIGRYAYFKGQVAKSIKAFEAASRINIYENWNAMCKQELGFMYAMCLKWDASFQCFLNAAESSSSMRSYHYFLAAACAGTLGLSNKVKLMLKYVVKTMREETKVEFYSSFVGKKSTDIIKQLKKRMDVNKSYYKLIIYEVLYVIYGVSMLSTDTLNTIITDCKEAIDDNEVNESYRYIKKLLTVVCRRQMMECDSCHGNLLHELITYMNIHNYQDHVYAYALYELAIEQINCPETLQEGKKTIQKMQYFKRLCYFRNFFEKRCDALEAYVKKFNES
ncbi:tetratricopeptide repeat protein 39C-like isoform X2 [Daktulosphaira vitifoliae]|nr:tetratricopeptide repeat protein 39C-like isoform X2 [Daktulosphaira vitifoliae]